MITKYDIKTTLSETSTMKTGRKQKFFTAILIFYWLGIFIATHIPVPAWTRQMGVSDKTMHFVAYMVLASLLWFSTSFEKKADWKKLRPWLLSTILLLYSLLDELSQHFMKRSTDPRDFAANALGLAVAMATVTFLPAFHAAMILVTVCPLFWPALVKSQFIPQNSMFEVGVYLAGFACITIIWIKYLSSTIGLNFGHLKHLPVFFAPPAGTAVILILYAKLTNKPFGTTAILSTFTSIIITLLIHLAIVRKKTAI
jgi:hypothetical protein